MTKLLSADYQYGWRDSVQVFYFQLELMKVQKDETAEAFKIRVLTELDKFGKSAPVHSR